MDPVSPVSLSEPNSKCKGYRTRETMSEKFQVPGTGRGRMFRRGAEGVSDRIVYRRGRSLTSRRGHGGLGVGGRGSNVSFRTENKRKLNFVVKT